VDVLDHDISTSGGVNVIEANAGFGSTPGFYDDYSVTVVPEPTAAAALPHPPSARSMSSALDVPSP
jgi:hypothetical protein